MKASEITQPGFYWYWQTGQEWACWVVVEVTEERELLERCLKVYWTGNEIDHDLKVQEGEFIGPILPPEPLSRKR